MERLTIGEGLNSEVTLETRPLIRAQGLLLGAALGVRLKAFSPKRRANSFIKRAQELGFPKKRLRALA